MLCFRIVNALLFLFHPFVECKGGKQIFPLLPRHGHNDKIVLETKMLVPGQHDQMVPQGDSFLAVLQRFYLTVKVDLKYIDGSCVNCMNCAQVEYATAKVSMWFSWCFLKWSKLRFLHASLTHNSWGYRFWRFLATIHLRLLCDHGQSEFSSSALHF